MKYSPGAFGYSRMSSGASGSLVDEMTQLNVDNIGVLKQDEKGRGDNIE